MNAVKFTSTLIEVSVAPLVISTAVQRFSITRPSPQLSVSARPGIPQYFPKQSSPSLPPGNAPHSTSANKSAIPCARLAITLTRPRLVQPPPANHHKRICNDSNRRPFFVIFQKRQFTFPLSLFFHVPHSTSKLSCIPNFPPCEFPRPS